MTTLSEAAPISPHIALFPRFNELLCTTTKARLHHYQPVELEMIGNVQAIFLWLVVGED